MAGDWIKMRGNLWDDPRIAKLCDLLDCGEAQVIGGLYWLWATADQHTQDGVMPGLTLRQIDRKTGVAGLAEALCTIGWIADHPEGIRICNFQDHNGASAKKRSETARRVAKSRAGNADVTHNALQNKHTCDTGALAREREEKEKSKDLAPNGACPPALPENPDPGGDESKQKPTYTVPDCPYSALIETYHTALPSMPRCEVLNDLRRGFLRTRWREVCAEFSLSRAEAIDWWRGYFEQAGQSDFLTGRAPPGKDRMPFVADLEWLMRPNNFAKVVEGRYQNQKLRIV